MVFRTRVLIRESVLQNGQISVLSGCPPPDLAMTRFMCTLEEKYVLLQSQTISKGQNGGSANDNKP